MLQTMKRPMGLGETAAYTTRNPKRLRLLVEPSLLGRKRESADNLESAIEYQILPTKHPRLWSEDKTPPAFVGANKAEASKVEELSRKSFEFSGTLKDFLGRDEKFLINATNKPDSKSRQLVLYQPPPNSSLGDGELEATETDNTNMMDVS